MERWLQRSKYISIVGILCLLLASVIAFVWGAVTTINTLVAIIASGGKDPRIAVALIGLVESFLIATALFVFAVSMYEMFVNKIGLPAWMLADDLPELEEKLGGVIILVMVVKFVEHLVEWNAPTDLFLFAVAISIVSIALIALSRFRPKE